MFKEANIAHLVNGRSLLDKCNDYDFEYACKYLLEKSGRFKHVWVTEKGPKGGDEGIDLKMRSSDNKIIAYGQCKLWHKRCKGLVKTIRELAGCMYRDKVNQGILLVTVDANEYEKEEAARCNIDIIDLSLLDSIIHTVKAQYFPQSIPSFHQTMKGFWMLAIFLACVLTLVLFGLSR